MEGSVTPINAADWADRGGPSDEQPDQVAVVAALRRMLNSEELRAAPRSRDFLAYVVTETLAGRGHRLKERTVARYALGRTKDFDAVTDAAARVQANRLRTSMERYYTGTGADEALVIDLPRGSYVPRFTYRGLTPTPSGRSSLEPGLVVVQFADFHSDGDGAPLALALTESLIHALGAFPGLRVIGPAVSERGVGYLVDARAAARVLDAQYVLTGTVRTTETLLRVIVRLSDGETGEVLWSDVCDQERTQITGFHDEDDLVRRIAATIGDFRGVVLRDTTARRAETRHPAAYAAMLSYYRYLDSGTPQAAEAATGGCAGQSPRGAHAQPRARTCVACAGGRGVRSRGHRELPAERQPRDRAEPVPPQHPLRVRRPAGAQRGLGGRPGEHPRVEPTHPHHPGYQHVHLALDRLNAGDHTGMLAEASLLTHPEDLWGPLIRCLAFIGLGHDDQAWQ